MHTEYMRMIQNSGEITDRGTAMLNLLKTNKQYKLRKELKYGIQS